MEDFFDFLNEHIIKHGFLAEKDIYTLENYFGYDYDLNKISPPIDGYYLVDIEDDEKELHVRYVYLNPDLLKIIIKIKKIGNDDFESEWSQMKLWEDLNGLYHRKIKSFFEDLLTESRTNRYSKEDINNIIVSLNWYKEQTNYFNYIIKDFMGNEDNLLYNTINNLINKIRDAFLKNEYQEIEIATSKHSTEYISISKKVYKPTHYGFYLDKSKEFINIDTILEPVWRLLKSERLIESRTKYSVFKKIFTYQKIKEKVLWLGEINQLYFFIKLLTQQKHYKHPRNTKKWEITVNCFILPSSQLIKIEQLQRTKNPLSEKRMVILEAVNQFTKLKCILPPILVSIYLEFFF